MQIRAYGELLRGKGAHADTLACVEDLSAELASWRAAGFPHSVGALVFHMNYWMDYELRRIGGKKPAYPEHAEMSWPEGDCPADAAEWDSLRDRLAELLEEFAALAKSKPEELDREIESSYAGDRKVAGSLQDVLWQMAVHNSYHVGQIALVRQALGSWPPKGGGDSW